MLQKLRKETAVVSVLLVTITITLTLTLTVSATATETETATKTAIKTVTAIDERTTAVNAITTSTRNFKGDAETTAVISRTQQGNVTTTATAATETTTTTFLTLQPPPLNVTSPTISSYEPDSNSESTAPTAIPKSNNVTAVKTNLPTKNSINHEIDKANNVTVKSDKKNGEIGSESNTKSEAEEKAAIEQQIPKELIKLLQDDLSHSIGSSTLLIPKLMTPQGFHPNDKLTTDKPNPALLPKGYINFEPKYPTELIAKEEQQKKQTVNEVLTSLFPNGFSDIFRFSYASEPTTPTSSTEAKTESTTSSSTLKTTTPNVESKTSVRYTTSISKEYRRTVSPGHTEIYVEKLALPNSSEEFNDGSNSITKDELLRINRAAVESPVLPSLLVKPSQTNETTPSAAPIVILKENSSEHDDLNDEVVDDNLIAESQDLAQHIFQRLPDTKAKQNYKHKAREVNVEIIHDETLRPNHKGIFGQRLFTPARELPKKELQTKFAVNTPIGGAEDKQNPTQKDHYQQHVEQEFKQPNSATEAPSRKFLKHFNPQLSESASGLVKKGHFHYESIGREQRSQSSTPTPGDYSDQYVKPAAQLQYQRQSNLQKQQSPNSQTDVKNLHTHITDSQPVTPSYEYKGYESTPKNKSPKLSNEEGNVVFVTVNTPKPIITPNPKPLAPLAPEVINKSPHGYVAEAVGAASQTAPRKIEEPKQNLGYTYVEVQKSVNIHNKLITEKDGQLVEQHETIYHQPQYAHNVAVSQQPDPVVSNNYVSLSEHPINVQHIEDSGGIEPHEEAASQTATHHIHPPAQQTQENYVEKLVPQPYPVQIEKIVDRPYPVTQIVEKPVPAPYPVKELVEKIVDRPVEVEKIVDRPVKVPYTVHVNHFIDRPYPVREIIEQPVAVPYAVPEPVAVPFPVETYIDRPYPVETIVEKPVPYPVQKIVEKVVEKHVPVEVERIVEKPKVIEKVVEKLVDRPIAIPIHVPVAVPVPPYPSHPNALSWTQGPPPPQRYQKIPAKGLGHSSVAPIISAIPISSSKVTKPTQPATPIQFTNPPFKISDIRFDLKPPPPPLGPSWSKGSRYIYNTLPAHLTTALVPDQEYGPQQQIVFLGTAPSEQTNDNESYDEFQRWRNGNTLKRSPDFGRNLHIEYGFKPPLVPSLEIDEKGMPLKSSLTKTED